MALGGLLFGMMGYAFGVIALMRVAKLEKKLKELKVLEPGFKST